MTNDAQILNYLENCLQNDSLAHAYLFLGPQTSGRMKILENFLPKLLHAKGATSAFGLGYTNAPIRNHPDIKIVEPDEGTVTIDQIRQLRHWLQLSPLASDKKAAVITAAERMNIESQNAFLKVMEEPAASTYIFLLAGHSRQVLPTIFSRTVPLYFPARNAAQSELLSPFLVAKDSSERLRLWLRQGLAKEEVRDWLYKVMPELRQLLLQTRSRKLAKTIKSLLESLAGPSGQNWQLIAESLIISI